MKPERTLGFALLLLAAGAASGCAGSRKLTYEKETLKREIKAEAPALTFRDIEIPFDVTPEQIAAARKYTAHQPNDLARAEKLLDAMMNPQKMGIQYADMETGTAAQTLKTKKGNCLSIASVHVGLARGIGLRANYMEATSPPLEVFANDDFVVNSGHVTAVVETETGKVALDFGENLGPLVFFRKMSDIEATAHFYNNRGFEIIHQAIRNNRPILWKEALKNFETASRLMPNFDAAWNNLGISSAHLGRYKEALQFYKNAISIKPKSATAHSNLGNLWLSLGKLDTAIESFETAAKLDPKSPHVHYRLGVALRKKGEFLKAAIELEQTLALRNDYPKACDALSKIYRDMGYEYLRGCAESDNTPTYFSKSKIFHM